MNSRENEEDKLELECQREAERMVEMAITHEAPPREPGAWIKRFGGYFKHLKDLKSHHFNFRLWGK